jgi:hypothetical protein
MRIDITLIRGREEDTKFSLFRTPCPSKSCRGTSWRARPPRLTNRAAAGSRILLRFRRLGTNLTQNDHASAHLDAVVEVHDVLVGHANAAGRDRLADRLRFIRAVDAKKRTAKIYCPRTERIVRSAWQETRQIRTAA